MTNAVDIVTGVMPRAEYPLDREFYLDLARRSDRFERVAQHVVPRGEGYGLRLEAGQTLRLVMMERANMLDVCLYNAEDVSEFYWTGAQVAIEGGPVTRFTRLWGNPPHSRPLATVLTDTVRFRPTAHPTRDHVSHGAHCTQHMWGMHGRSHSRACYDNLRQGLAMLGLHQRHIHDNVNLFFKLGIDPITGHYVSWDPSDAEEGDYVELYAEIPLLLSISVCPWGNNGTVVATGWSDNRPLASPLGLDVYETGVEPLGWPYR